MCQGNLVEALEINTWHLEVSESQQSYIMIFILNIANRNKPQTI